MSDQQLISVVVPIFNEQGNIFPLIKSISNNCASMHHEIICINDGSSDKSLQELNEISKEIKNLSVIDLKRNFGQTAAIAAGVDQSQGEVIVLLDGDGQNDPSDIPKLVNILNQGYDLVSGWRENRRDNFILRKIPSWIANRIISSVSGVRLHDFGCTLKAYRRSIIKSVQLGGEMHRFLAAWCVWQGGKICEVPVKHHPRTQGSSKYGLSRTFKVVIDLITLKFFSGYIFKPNYFFSGTGLILLGGSTFSALIAIIDKFGFDQFPKYRIPLLLLSVFLGISGLVICLMGLLAEILVRLYFEIRNQKPYRLSNE